MKNDYETQERISALLDGESASPNDAALRCADAAVAEQYRQYQEIGRLMNALPTPEPSPYFVRETLARLHQKKHFYNRRLYVTLAAAATLLLTFAFVLYQMSPPSSPELPDAPQSFTAAMDASLLHLDIPDDELHLLLPEALITDNLEHAMAFFEEMPVDALLIALAEMTFDDCLPQYAPVDGATVESISEADEKRYGSFTDVFMLLETLNHAEVDALNRLLRVALAEA